MFSKLAGHLPLADMVSQIIDDSRSKIAAAESEKEEKKDDKKKKLLKFEEKEHGHIPSVKEEEEEKKASAVIDYSDPEEVEKLASALDIVGEQLMKTAADMQDHGKEYKGGGESLAVMKPVAGKQNYGKDKSKSHNVPEHTPEQSGDAGGPAKTQVENDHKPGKLLKYLHAEYPKKGVLKTAAETVIDKVRAAAKPAPVVEEKEAAPAEETKAEEKPKSAAVARLQDALLKNAAVKGYSEDKKGNPKLDGEKYDPKSDSWKKDKKAESEKTASPVDYILSKIAEGEVEKRMGGETLDSKSGDGPKPAHNPGRELIESNSAATNAKKVQAKNPRKKEMAQVLTEPMFSKAHDAKVQENLRNASKGGVKIAAARELLKKIAAEGCTCDGKGECKHCKMKKAMEKKSTGMPMTGASGAGSSMPSPTM